jgi:hypothetical protein
MTHKSNRGRVVPPRARALAAELASLFEEDSRLVAQLNETHHRLENANSRLWSGLHPDALALLYENTDRLAISEGSSVIAGIVIDAIGAGGDEQEVETAVLPALQEAHWRIHRAFVEYQAACEERRQLAVTVGELAQQLADVLTAAGWPPAAARSLNVHQLAAGTC